MDTDSFLLVFKPSQSVAKPLGNLIRASTVGEDESTLVVTTSDALHRSYRFTFSSPSDSRDFQSVAAAAEAAQIALSSRSAQARDSGRTPRTQRATDLCAALEEKYFGRWPLVFGGVDLYGPAPGGGGEALLGSGALLMLDPEDSGNKVGSYALHFFSEDDGASKPVTTFQFGPKMSLKRQPVDSEDADAPAASFDLTPGRGLQAHTVSFDDAATAAAFARDFRVRSRLLDVSLKTAQGQRSVDEARNEIRELHQQSLGARLKRFILLLIALFFVAIVVRAAMLYKLQPGKAPVVYVQQLAKDVRNAASVPQAAARVIGSQACQYGLGAVPHASLQQCLSQSSLAIVRDCVAKLVPDA